ncbi:CAP domain-containing protein [Hymenobacter terrenus]|uniref:CAP domain-containing protein n=1 Tax=Hymenobacter terrenus TaxID=1629124 RepID=UPI00069680CB|nr:CAP domain-containing protein [Hymenobacter terrenus]
MQKLKITKVLLFAFGVGVFTTSCQKDRDEPTPAPSATKSSSNASAYESLENEVLQLINQDRAAQGLPALVNNPAIADEARGHSQNMGTGAVGFGHAGFSSRTSRLKTYVSWTGAAENVAYGSNSAKAIVDMWLKSTSGHRENIRGNYNLTGVGIALGKNGYYYFTQIFLKGTATTPTTPTTPTNPTTPTPPPTTPTTPTTPSTGTTLAAQILDLVNQHRASLGLPAFAANSVIASEAQGHTQNMASGAVAFGHTGFNSRFNRIVSQIGGSSGAKSVVARAPKTWPTAPLVLPLPTSLMAG